MILDPIMLAAVDTSLVGILIAGLSALSGVVLHLYKQVEKNTEAIRADLKECREDREALWKSIQSIEKKAGG